MLRTKFFEIADERGIRYNWLANQMGYTPEYLSRIKRGTFPITEEFQRRACAIFSDVPAPELFFDLNGELIHHSVTESKVSA